MKLDRLIAAALAALMLVAAPIEATAKPGQGNGQGHGRQHVQKQVQKPHGKSAPAMLLRAAPHRAEGGIAIAGCPPGLAKKSPACVPPGQAKKAQARQFGSSVGQYVDLGRVHVISHPGRYGLSTPPRGNRYAIVDGKLVRVDEGSGQILSILRVIDAILD